MFHGYSLIDQYIQQHAKQHPDWIGKDALPFDFKSPISQISNIK